MITAQCAADGVGSETTDWVTLTTAPPVVNVAPLPTWSIADQSFSEGVGNAVVEIVLSQTSGVDELVDFATTQGTANSSAPGQDYGNSEVSGTVTIPAGETSTTTTIPIIDDGLDEPDETFTITLSNPTGSGGATIGDGTGIITITDDDDTPTVSMAVATASIDEGDTGTSTISLTADLSAVSGLPVTVTYSTFVTGTSAAAAGNDYVGVTGGTLLIAAGDPGGTIQIVINGDEDVELDDTFGVSLDSATTTYGTVTVTAPTATDVTITNDDVDPDLSAPPTATIPVPPLGVNVTGTIPVTIAQAWIGKDVVVTYTVTPGTAATPADYIDDISAGSVTISAGSTTANIEITIVGDDTIDGSTNFTVTLTGGSNATLTGADTTVVSLVEKPTISITDATAYETSSTVTLTVTINPTSTAITTVEFDTGDGTAIAGAAYTASSAAAKATIPAGQTSANITVGILPDALDEHDETFTVTLDDLSVTGEDDNLGLAIVNPSAAVATVTIIDDDALPVLSIADPADVPEEVASGIVSFTITLAPVSGRDVTVSYATQDGPTPAATAGLDYGATSSSATIAAGQTSFTFDVTIIDDAIKEPNEKFSAVLSAQVYATLDDTASSSVATIIDNEVRPEISIGNVEVVEGVGAVLTISQDIETGEDVLVDYVTSGGTATAGSDYTYVSTTATIIAGTTSTDVTIATINDSEEEDAETVEVTLSNPVTADPAGAFIADGIGLAVINDNEPAAKVVTIVSEGEAMPGDMYFVVVAGTPTDMTGFVSIASVSEILQKTYGLDEVRTKASTYVMLAMATGTAGVLTHADASGGDPTDTDLLIVGKRTNRNFYLFPGTNFTGLGLVPTTSSIADLLEQSVPNANQELIDAIKAANLGNTDLDRDVVKLEDVIGAAYAFPNTLTSQTFKCTYTLDPILVASLSPNICGALPGLTDVKPFQGMLIVTREAAGGDTVAVFDEATASVELHPVPVRLNIVGPFLPAGNVSPESVNLAVGFHLIAPHIWAQTPYDTVFAGSGGDISQTFSSAISRWQAVEPWSDASAIYAEIVDVIVTESASIPPFVGPGVLSPELAYWIRVAEGTPTLTATGPSTFDWP